MENEPNPHENYTEVLTEAECARRLSVTRETLSRMRHRTVGPIPYVPLSDGPSPNIRYIWPDVIAWLRSRSRNLTVAPAFVPPKRGRPRNVDRQRDDGASR